jgi:plasmid stabilization system protein ParE
MLYTHLLYPLAHQDIIEAYDWYESSKTGLGEEFAATIKKIIDEIIRHPQTYSSKYNLNYREAIIRKFPHVIVYKINERKKEIFIASIHHAKKHPRLKYR